MSASNGANGVKISSLQKYFIFILFLGKVRTLRGQSVKPVVQLLIAQCNFWSRRHTQYTYETPKITDFARRQVCLRNLC